MPPSAGSFPLTTRSLAHERALSKRLVNRLHYADSDEAIISASEAVAEHVAQSRVSARAASLLSEAGALRVATSHLSAVTVSPVSTVLVACLELVRLLACNLNGAKEFAVYGGHALILRLLQSRDEKRREAAEELLGDSSSGIGAPVHPTSFFNFTSAAMAAGVPFPTLRKSEVLGDDEILHSNPLLEYRFDSQGGGAVIHQCLKGRGGANNSYESMDSRRTVSQDSAFIAAASATAAADLAGQERAAATEDPVCVVVRAVTDAQESQYTVGYLMWPAAIILGRWIRRELHGDAPRSTDRTGGDVGNLLLGRSVHEVGAGIGLPGLVAAISGATSVTLSDFNPRVVTNISENIELNTPQRNGTREFSARRSAADTATSTSVGACHTHGEECAAEGNSARQRCIVSAVSLDWAIFEETSKVHSAEETKSTTATDQPYSSDSEKCVATDPVDLVIASDVICQKSDARLLAQALKRLIKKTHGVGVVIAPCPENRFGTEALPEALTLAGLAWEATPISNDTGKSRHEHTYGGVDRSGGSGNFPSLTRGIEEAKYFSWNAYACWHGDGVTPNSSTSEGKTKDEEWQMVVIQAVRSMGSKEDSSPASLSSPMVEKKPLFNSNDDNGNGISIGGGASSKSNKEAEYKASLQRLRHALETSRTYTKMLPPFARRRDDAGELRHHCVAAMTEMASRPNITADIFVDILEALEGYDSTQHSSRSNIEPKNGRMTTTTPPLPHAPDSLQLVEQSATRDLSLYGVTPASSFVRLLCSPLLGIAEIRDDQLYVSSFFQLLEPSLPGAPPAKPTAKPTAKPAAVVVLGCSVGWSCVYASFLLGVPSRGVDLVAARVAYGNAVLQTSLSSLRGKCRISESEKRKIDHPEAPESDDGGDGIKNSSYPDMASLIELRVQDAQDAQLSDAMLIFEITSFGDTPVRRSIWRHIASDAPDGAVIVAYDRMPVLTPAPARCFEYRGFIELPTSWTPLQPFYVYALNSCQSSQLLVSEIEPPFTEPDRIGLLAAANCHVSARYGGTAASTGEEAPPSLFAAMTKPGAGGGRSSLESKKAATGAVVGSLEAMLGIDGRVGEFLSF